MANQNTATQERVTKGREEFPSRALAPGAQTWWATMADCQQEIGQFIAGRLTKDGEAIRQSLGCCSWADALDVQARWADETLRDYNEEMQKLTGLYAKAASSAVRHERRAALIRALQKRPVRGSPEMPRNGSRPTISSIGRPAHRSH